MTINTPKLEIGDNQLIYGDARDNFASINDVGGQDVVLWGSTVAGGYLDGIQIGAAKYGRTSGVDSIQFTLPPNGVFMLKSLAFQSNDNANCVGWLSIGIDNAPPYSMGGDTKKGSISFSFPLNVKFKGLYYSDAHINAIVFEYVSQR